MTTPKVFRPDFEVEVHGIGTLFRAILWRIWVFFTLPHKYVVNIMMGEKKFGEMVMWIFPRIKIIYRRE